MTIPTPRTSPESSWSLVERAQAGDRDAFADIYTANHDRVFRFIHYRLGMDVDTAADLTQDTFVRCLRYIGQVSNQGRDISSWLYTIARNLTADHMKSGRVRMQVLTGEPWEFERVAPDDPEGDAITAELARTVRAHVLPAMADLCEDQRRMLELRFFEDLSPTEAAEVLGRTTAAGKTLQHRAMTNLRRDRLVRALGGES